jgi:hypothetical protein
MALEPPPHSSSTEHAYHCFDYLRHSFMCAGDMTLEVVGTPPSGPGMPSWADAMHTCKNWQDVVSWQEQHYSPMI